MESFRVALPEIQGTRMVVHGIQGDTTVSASAYDVPRFMEVKLDHATRVLRIEFGYPDREDSTPHEVQKGFSVLVGVNSGKLLGFVVKEFQKPGEVTVGLIRVVDQQLQRATRENQRLNYQTIRDVVQNKMEKALQAV